MAHSRGPTGFSWEKLSPGVKEEYRKIERQKEADFLRLEAKYKEIENTQIYDGE